MKATDAYSNFKMNANIKFFEMAHVISRQKRKEKELQELAGVSPFMGTLMSTLTTGDMKAYNKAADNYPDCPTPTQSGLSTPEPT